MEHQLSGQQAGKKTWYVSVQAGTVLENRGDAAYEFEIRATEKEANKLREQIELKEKADENTFYRAHIPVVPYHEDQENDAYDASLKRIYEMIYAFGTESTKMHMESMKML